MKIKDTGRKPAGVEDESSINEIKEIDGQELPLEEVSQQELSTRPIPPLGASEKNWLSAQEQKNNFSGTFPSTRLAVMPLTVLLPALGDITSLSICTGQLESRYRQLQAQNVSPPEEVESWARLGEESMLNQVLQWLSGEKKQ